MMNSYIIFLVDDDQFLLNLYVNKFKNLNHEVVAFSSGKELIVALREQPKIDALLLDIIMPDMDGFEILETLRKEHLAQGAKIIVLSNQDIHTEKIKQFDIDGYIVKASAIPSEVVEKTIGIIKHNSV